MLCAVAALWLGWLLTLSLRPSPWLVASSGLPILLWASWLGYNASESRRQGGGAATSWRTFLASTWDLHALVLVLTIALAVQFADTHGVTTDGVIYFSQLRSAIFDRDLDVAAEFAYLQQPPRPSHVVPIGPTVVWAPLYLVVAGVDGVGRALDFWPGPSDAVGLGLTLPYIRAALVTSFAIGALGLWVIHLRLRREFSPPVALAATLLLFLATPLVWYMVYEPSMTHAASFGFVALFVVAAERETSAYMSKWASIGLGALLGLAFLTRPQEAVFALFPATLLFMSDQAIGERVRGAARLAAWAFVGALPFLLLQAVHSSVLLSRESFALTGDRGYLDLLNSRWADTLWSSWHGFFSWSPVAYVAFAATFFYAVRNRRWAIAAILIVLVMAWVNGATADWAGGWSFGGRRFVSVLVVLAPGLAWVVHGLTQRPMVALSLIAAAAIGWNQFLIAQYATGLLRPEPIAFSDIVRQQAATATRPPFFYPFSFPANVWFAWRAGLPIDRYDLLGVEPLLDSFDLTMAGASGKYLLEGWGGRSSDAFGDLRWIEGPRAELAVPLDITDGRDVTVAIQARTRLLDPPETVTFAVLVNGREIGTLTPDATLPSSTTFTLRAGDRLLKRGFNRVAFERRQGNAPVAIYGMKVE